MTDQRNGACPPTGRQAIRERPGDQPDEALLGQIAEGDGEALGSLYDRWAPRVHCVAHWILQNADDADDVVHETFWQVWRTARRYDWRRGAGSTWLLMIARSRALDRLRTRRRHDLRIQALSATGARFAEGRLDGWDPSAQEPSAPLVEAIRELSSEQREVLELAFFTGLTHAEIAAQTALPLGTVKTRVRLALQKLRQRLCTLRHEDP